MIPSFVNLENKTPWPVLPPGIHQTTMEEVRVAFATNDQRILLFDGFQRAVSSLVAAGCRLVYLDGSFVTEKPNPNDFDGCWDSTGVDPTKLDPVLLKFENGRAAQKAKYFGELFIAYHFAAPGIIFLDYFQVDRYSSEPKGLLVIPLVGGIALSEGVAS